ncbi:MAG: hypothetical protein IJB86_07895 [Clostridia bacterium]|nr:hypothetical protein [Clostridia bacterium]
MEQGLADESSHFEHTLVNTADKQLKAVMIIENGTVNIDQLGAKGDGAFPITFEEYLESHNTPVEPPIKKVHDYGTSLVAANSGKTDNNSTIRDNNIITRIGIIDDALSHEDVKEVRLTHGKCYCISAKINIPSGKVLNGCGAMLMPLQTLANGTDESTLIYMSGVSDIEVKDIRLYHCLTTGNNSTYNKCFYIADCNNIHIHDVTMENANYGMDITSSNANIRLENLHIEKVITGIEYSFVTGGYLVDSYISCDWNIYNEGHGNHCIYASRSINNYTFENLTLLNAGEGTAIQRNWADEATDDIRESDSLVIKNIIIDNCYCAVNVGHNTHNCVIENIIATNVRYCGLVFAGVKNVVVTNCSFSGHPDYTSAGGAFNIPSNKSGSPNYYVNDLVIKNCHFDFHHKFFTVGNSRNVENDNMLIKDCTFKINDIVIDYTKAKTYEALPAHTKGVLSFVEFAFCDFIFSPIPNSASEIDELRDIYRNGVFFSFGSNRRIYMHWSFRNCNFINNAPYTINSAIMNEYYTEGGSHIFCTVKKCMFVGFRFVLRNSKIMQNWDSEATITDPAWDGEVNSEDVISATNALASKNRFVSYNNIYFTDYHDAHYKKTEEYGYGV